MASSLVNHRRIDPEKHYLNSVSVNSVSSQIEHEDSDGTVDVGVPLASFRAKSELTVFWIKSFAFVKILKKIFFLKWKVIFISTKNLNSHNYQDPTTFVGIHGKPSCHIEESLGGRPTEEVKEINFFKHVCVDIQGLHFSVMFFLSFLF